MKENALEIYINSEFIAVIAIENPGVLGGMVEIRITTPDQQRDNEDTLVMLHMHGLENLDRDHTQSMVWDSKKLKAGDSVLFKIIANGKKTPSRSTEVHDRLTQKEALYQQYLHLKAYFEKA